WVGRRRDATPGARGPAVAGKRQAVDVEFADEVAGAGPQAPVRVELRALRRIVEVRPEGDDVVDRAVDRRRDRVARSVLHGEVRPDAPVVSRVSLDLGVAREDDRVDARLAVAL